MTTVCTMINLLSQTSRQLLNILFMTEGWSTLNGFSRILANFRYIYAKEVFLPEDTVYVPRDEEDATKCSSFFKFFSFPHTNRKTTSTNGSAILTVGSTIYDNKRLMSLLTRRWCIKKWTCDPAIWWICSMTSKVSFYMPRLSTKLFRT